MASSSSRLWRTYMLLVLLQAAQLCSAKMAAWWTPKGPEVIRQDPKTGGIMYSMCNSNGTAVFPENPPLTFPLDHEPRNDTALSGQGWYSQGTTWGSIFYQDTAGKLINSVFICDWQTGQFIFKGTTIMSDAKDMPPAHNTTGIASVILGSTEGYRVFYQDEKMRVHQLSWANNVNENHWAYAGLVSQDAGTNHVMMSQFSAPKNISLVYPKDDGNIEVARHNNESFWHMVTLPRPLAQAWNETTNRTSANITSFTLDQDAKINFTLPAWTGTPKSLGVSIDSHYTRSIFYLGSDKKLYQVACINNIWRMMNNQTENLWPVADEASGELALAQDFKTNNIRIYYEVGGKLNQIKYDKTEQWKAAEVVPTTNATAVVPNEPTTSDEPTPDATPAPSTGLSTGQQAGIGVGVSLGAIAVAGVAALFFIRRRQAKRDAEAAAAVEAAHQQEARQYTDYAASTYGRTASSYGNSPAPQSAPPYQAWPVDKKYAVEPQEVSGLPRSVYEMPEQTYSHEMSEQLYSHELVGDQGQGVKKKLEDDQEQEVKK